MERFIPYEKLSKKQKKLENRKKRTTWGDIKPVTRTKDSAKHYSRKKKHDWKDNQTCFYFA